MNRIAAVAGGFVAGTLACGFDFSPFSSRENSSCSSPSSSSSSSLPKRSRSTPSSELRVSRKDADSGPHWAAVSIQGRRNHMEDEYCAYEPPELPSYTPFPKIPDPSYLAQESITLGDPESVLPEFTFFSVMDGHSGGRASKFAKGRVPFELLRFRSAVERNENLSKFDIEGYEHAKISKLIAESPSKSWIPAAIASAIRSTDTAFLHVARQTRWHDGCTLCCAVVEPGKLFVGNIGDSRAVLVRKDKGVALSEDHKPSTLREKARLEAHGAWEDRDRICGRLNLTRGIGDRMYKNPWRREAWWVIAEPDVSETVLNDGDGPLILATDGLWDALDNDTAARIVAKHGDDLVGAAVDLVNTAVEEQSTDNITALVVSLDPWSGKDEEELIGR